MTTTIIIPVWARESEDLEFLGQCLESACPQSPVIVWNDGSVLSLAPLEKEFPMVSFYHDDHLGKSYARNHAVEKATTELVYPLDADDWIAPDTIEYLEEQWQGVPIYSWVWKWYSITEQALHELPTFSCRHTRNSIASVNVLHSKEQWHTVGGWDERYNLYEDWLYNAKLFWLFCAQLVAVPLVFYRQHPRQSTNIERNVEGRIRKQVRREIAQFIEGNQNMACCGKRRKNQAPVSRNKQGASSPISFTPRTPGPPPSTGGRYGPLTALPAESSGQIIQARYVGGKGRGSHIYRDPDTRHAYRVKNGMTLNVDIADTTTEAERQAGHSRKMLIRIVPPPPPPPPAPAPAPPPLPPEPAPTPPPMPEEKAEATVVSDLASLPGTVAEIKLALDKGISQTQAVVWLHEEKAKEKPRITALKMLGKAANG